MIYDIHEHINIYVTVLKSQNIMAKSYIMLSASFPKIEFHNFGHPLDNIYTHSTHHYVSSSTLGECYSLSVTHDM